MTDLPLFDARGGSLASFELFTDASETASRDLSRVDCSLVVVEWNRQVLFGFNVSRQQWELPGGTVEDAETSRETALRELAEETGIVADRVLSVARAELVFGDEATRYRAEVFAVVLTSAPELIESNELSEFRWWDPHEEPWYGMDNLDAEIVRRICVHE